MKTLAGTPPAIKSVGGPNFGWLFVPTLRYTWNLPLKSPTTRSRSPSPSTSARQGPECPSDSPVSIIFPSAWSRTGFSKTESSAKDLPTNVPQTPAAGTISQTTTERTQRIGNTPEVVRADLHVHERPAEKDAARS